MDVSGVSSAFLRFRGGLMDVSEVSARFLCFQGGF